MPDVLIIDDDDGVRGLLVALVQAEGLSVAAARDGREGLALFRSERARVVVTDLFMPGMDGLEVIQVLRRLAPEVRVIAVSGGGRYEIPGTLGMAGQLGAVATIKKPFEPEEFVTAVRAALTSE